MWEVAKIQAEAQDNKDKRREDAIKDVEKITDGLRFKIDEGIKDAVIALKMGGFEMDGSCEGHVDRASPFPWVDIVAPTRSDPRYLELRKKYKAKNISPSEIKEGLALEEKVKKEEKEIEKSLKELISEFYKNSNPENPISVKKYASWFRLQPARVDKFDAPKYGTQFSEAEKKPRAEFLEKSRKEMGRFIAFFKAKI